ncbi:MAG: SRPBCC domain-containing protein [Actinoplanes sp.]
MKITNEFTVRTPIDRAWQVLTDLPGIAPCMPGAQLTGVQGDTYAGRVKVKVGPVVSDFAGTARFVEKDEETGRAVIDAKGRDSRSAGNAAALVTAQLTANGNSTLVSVDTDLKISGKLAQFGSGMIKEVSGKLLGQFVTNLEAKLAAEETPPAPILGTPASAAAPTSVPATAVGAGVTEPLDDETNAPGTEAGERPVDAAATTPASLAEEAPGATEPASAAMGAGQTAASSPDGGACGDSGPVPGKATAEPEPLDLMALAGGSVYKRIVPLGIGVAAVAVVIIWFVARR